MHFLLGFGDQQIISIRWIEKLILSKIDLCPLIESCSYFLLLDYLLKKHFGFEIAWLIRLFYIQLFEAVDLIGIDNSVVGLTIFVLKKFSEGFGKPHFVAVVEEFEVTFLSEEEDFAFEIAED